MRNSTLRTICALVLLSTNLAHAAEPKLPPASVGVAPNRIEVEVGQRPVTESATVINLADHPITIDASVVNWDLDENNDFRELPPAQGSLPAAIMLNPTRFTIPEGASQTVRFMIMPERLKTAGEHRAMIFFSETVGTDHSGVKIRFRLGIPVYAAFGELKRDLTVHDISLDQNDKRLKLAMDISAEGNAHVRANGYYLMWPSADFPGDKKALRLTKRLANDPKRKLPKGALGGVIAPKPVMPGSRRQVASPLIAPNTSGEFKLAMYVDAGVEHFERVLALTY